VSIFAAILKRALQLAVLLLLVTSATFWLSSLLPGDFFTVQELDPAVRKETVDRMRQRYGLDQPLLLRYGRWLAQSAHLDLGDSYFYQLPVRGVVIDALTKSLWMGIPALVFGLGGGILLGTIHALRRDHPFGYALDVLSAAALALPTLILGLGALLVAAFTHWFPLGDMNSSSLPAVGWLTWGFDRLHHMVLPVACLTVPIFAYVERIQCAAAQEILHTPFLRAARARGLPGSHIFVHYLLRPALNPILSAIGPLFAGILSGSLVLEVIFNWPGLGQVTLNGLLHWDTPLVAGCVILSTLLLVTGNLAADLLLMVLDPRTRIQDKAL